VAFEKNTHSTLPAEIPEFSHLCKSKAPKIGESLLEFFIHTLARNLVI